MSKLAKIVIGIIVLFLAFLSIDLFLGESTVPEQSITEKTSLTPIPGEQKQLDQLWSIITTIVPKTYTDRIESVEAMDEEEKEEGTEAYVEPLDDSLTRWKLALNNEAIYDQDGPISDREEFYKTVIHEFMHVITLHKDQVRPTEDICAPQEFSLPEGCARETSYITQFVKQFWPQIEQDRTIGERFDSHQDWYVNDYAATNPGEDIAESFAFFVTQEKKQNLQTIADQKTNFFYNYPELVELRSTMREGIEQLNQE